MAYPKGKYLKIYIMRNSLIFFFLLFSVTTMYSQKQATYPFNVAKSGTGSQSIIFIPGFASSGAVWDATVAIHGKNYTCYVLTMAGFAGVEPREVPTFNHWKSRIADFIKNEHIEKPIIIGHSMGGGLALAIAADYPDLVSKIVVVDALPCLAALTNPNFKQQDNIDCTASIAQMTAMSNDQFYEMQKSAIPQLTTSLEMAETIVGWSVKSDRETFAQMYCDFFNTDLREKLKSIQSPSLILLESYFKYFKPGVEEQYKNLKTANLQFADRGLHFVMYDDKEWYDNQLMHYLKIQ